MGWTGFHYGVVGIGLLLVGCGGGGGDGGGGGGGSSNPPPPPNTRDLRIAEIMTMPEDSPGQYMVHAKIAFANSIDGTAAAPVEWRVRGAGGGTLASGTVASLAPNSLVEVMAHVSGVAANDVLTFDVDPAGSLTETQEANNTTTTTAIRPPESTISDGIDLLFSDTHHHGAYYFRDPRFHFFIRNPNTRQVNASNVTFVIYDNGVERYRATIPEVSAPTPGQIEAGNGESDNYVGTDYEGEEILVSTEALYGSERPEPGSRHEYVIVIDPDNTILEANEANNMRRIIVEVPTTRAMAATPSVTPDFRHNNPHVHHYSSGAVFHFYLENFTAGSATLTIPWQLRHEDGTVLMSGNTDVPAMGIVEEIFWQPRQGVGEERYFLELDPGRTVSEADEDNNRAVFILDWTPQSSG
ncbi:MAG TPA: hypothetical protein VEL07_19545 [Planctomycetota bacterium]|nr:hypothetical protein [Planctomycetota bacterium]